MPSTDLSPNMAPPAQLLKSGNLVRVRSTVWLPKTVSIASSGRAMGRRQPTGPDRSSSGVSDDQRRLLHPRDAPPTSSH